jgi:hypothetical protein
VLHHFGKNPYEKHDPLSLGNFTDAHENMVSHCELEHELHSTEWQVWNEPL